MAKLRLDEFQPLEVEFNGRTYQVRHPADLTDADILALQDVYGNVSEGVENEAAIRAMRQALNVLSPELAEAIGGRPFLAMRVLSWYAKEMEAYVASIGAPVKKASGTN